MTPISLPVNIPWLSLLVYTPLVGCLILFFVRNRKITRYLALMISIIPLLISILLWLGYYTAPEDASSYRFLESRTWIKEVGISYLLGVDGLSLPFLFLTALLTTLAIVFSWDIEPRCNQFFALLLMLEVGLLGVFSALDFFLFYIFWEVVLIPMYFLIAIWGGPNRDYAAIKFLIYTHVASVVMLVSIFALYFSTGGHSFSMIAIATTLHTNPAMIPISLQMGIFGGFLFGFGVKMPIVPFHTWLPDAHVEAPTAGSVLLAGVLLKMGGYGLLRVAVTLLPEGAEGFALPMAVIGCTGIIYAAFLCLAQKDFKRMVAYSSISHMGIVMLGVSTLSVAGINGAVFQMFAHGLITAVLFMMAGVIHHKTGTRDIPSLGGLTPRIPVAMSLLVAGCLASLGLPGMVSFPSEVLVFIATYSQFGFWVFVPLLGVVVTAAYYLWAVQRVAFGKFKLETKNIKPVQSQGDHTLHDVYWYEALPLVLLLLLIVVFGVYPRFVLDIINSGVTRIADQIGLPGGLP